MDRTLTTEQIETLKTMDWQGDRNGDLLYFTNTNDSYFQDITGVCVSCLRELLGSNNTMESFYWEIAYRFHKESDFFDLHYAIWCKGDIVKDGIIQEFDDDVLGLFTENKPDTDWQEALKTLLENIFKNPEADTEKIVDFIDSNFPCISDKIRENCIDNLVPSDLDDSLKEDIARDWIDDNTNDAWDKVWDSLDSYDIKDKIIEYLSDNL